jgi:flagellar hook-associated protein 2
MASISSLGIGSGLDLGNLVNSLIDAERAPTENSLNRREGRLSTELSGLGLFRGAITGFRSALSGLSNPDNYSIRNLSNGNSSALTASVTNDAAVGSYAIDITNLAENHSLASNAFTSLNDVVGEGSIQIRFGAITGPGFASFSPDAEATVHNITIDSTNNTLSGLRDYINEGDFGVRASIINDGSGYRLTLQSETSGADGAMEITVNDIGDGNSVDAFGLSRLAFNASATQMTQTQQAEDASLIVNGLPVTSSTNSLSDMIEGVSINLLEETDGETFTLAVNEDTTSISDSMRKAVEAYNEMMTSLKELGQAGAEGTQSGILVGDNVLRSFINGVRAQMTGAVAGLTGSITALSTIGITTQADGSLSINESVFGSALSDNPLDALALFAPLGQLDDNQMSFNGYTDDSRPGSYAVNITQMATRGTLNGAGGLAASIVIDGTSDNLSFLIDGVSTGTIALTQATYTREELATELQLQINSSNIRDSDLSVTVTYNAVNNRFDITSNQYGSASQIEITSVDTVDTTTKLGLSVATGIAGQDVAGSIGGSVSTGEGQILTATTGNAKGLSLAVTDGVAGGRGALQFTRGFVEQLESFIDGYLDPDGILAVKEEGVNDSLEDIQDERRQLSLRLETLEARLVAQFSALDALVANFQTTGNFLAQQINNLPGSGALLNNDN